LLFSDPIQTESAGILLRSRLQSVARRLGFSDGRRENMALVASEMVTNLIKHAGGKGMLQIWEQPGGVLDLVSFDYGPGVDNLSLAQQDGFSTTRTLGKGLGSMQRLSDQFAIFSQKQRSQGDGRWHGTTIWCRFRQRAASAGDVKPEAPPACDYGLFVRSLADDRHNGDHVYVDARPERLRLFHLDGLGHGESAELATAHLDKYVSQASSLSHLVETVDRHLRTTTRGAVAIACELDPAAHNLHMLGVGDMATHLCQLGQVQHFSFAPGVLGREHKTPRLTETAMERGAVLISTSDGIRRGWDEDSFPGLCNHHPQMVAYVIGNTMARMTDDQSVCALRLN
jgi:anti-sigma regulatory factor (Ser/Thr protein kinase)